MDLISASFIPLDLVGVLLLLIFGFVGGLVSGFIGSGGAFVLTPAMMSIGVPGIVAVASNICHKFPKALVGALKRAKYGQVDWKLGLVLGVWLGNVPIPIPGPVTITPKKSSPNSRGGCSL